MDTIEIREITALPTGRLPSVEGWRSRRRAPGDAYEIDLKEPRPASGNPNRESAAKGSIVNLKENSMSTQYNLVQAPLQESRARMAAAFQDLGFSEESAKSAAAGRDNEPVALPFSASLRESLHRIDGVGGMYPDSIVIRHPSESSLRESTKVADLRESEAQAAAANQERMVESFVRMGMDPTQAARAARGRG